MLDLSKNLDQQNKEIIRGFWQALNHAGSENAATVIQAHVSKDISWNGSHPINHLQGADVLIKGFWQPLLRSFPDLKRKSDIFLGGESVDGEHWVSATGYFIGTFTKDWLNIPATGEKTFIRFGENCRMENGKIVESFVLLDLLDVIRQAGYQVLPPAHGAEGGRVPGPTTGDGVLLTERDELESRKSVQMINAMGRALYSYDRKSLSSMEQVNYWDPQMHWYGPSGIGECRSLEQFEDFHQRHWLKAFADRPLHRPGGPGRIMETIAEGHYAATGGWDYLLATHTGEYLGCPPTGKIIKIRDFDWYRREGDRICENWVLIDLIDIFKQFGIDLFERLSAQVTQRKAAR